jgi:NADPH-dependent 2,4-dienoyl-CoA reductase/sulfur reductase-like enzyme
VIAVTGFGPSSRIVIAGGSIAGLSAARELRALGFLGRLTVVDCDPLSPYRRPEVSKKLLTEEIRGRTRLSWPADERAEMLVPARIEAADLAGRTITVDSGSGPTAVPFDGLVVATGARARRPSFAGDNTYSLRSAADATRLRGVLAACRDICVVGGGLIGLEVAARAVSLGKRAVVVEAARLPMLGVLGAEPARDHLRLLTARGVEFRLGATVANMVSSADRRSLVGLTSGEELAADVVLVAVGASPRTDWLTGNGLDLTDGVRCDEHCAVVGAEDVVACGDVASWFNPLLGRQMRVEHWGNAIEQGEYAARRLMGTQPPTGFASLPYFWSDQADLKLQMLGSSQGHDDAVTIDSTADSLVAEYRAAGRLLAVVGINAGAAVMARRPEIIRAYESRSHQALAD